MRIPVKHQLRAKGDKVSSVKERSAEGRESTLPAKPLEQEGLRNGLVVLALPAQLSELGKDSSRRGRHKSQPKEQAIRTGDRQEPEMPMRRKGRPPLDVDLNVSLLTSSDPRVVLDVDLNLPANELDI